MSLIRKGKGEMFGYSFRLDVNTLLREYAENAKF